MSVGVFSNGLFAVDIIAHRGENSLAPENTTASAKIAWERGDKFVECDIHAVSDGSYVCVHGDRELKKIWGVDKKVSELKSAELKNITLAQNKNWRRDFSSLALPSYGEIIATVPADEVLVVKIKAYSDDFVKETERLMKKYGLEKRQIIFISFNHEAIKSINKNFHGYDTFLLSGLKKRYAD